MKIAIIQMGFWGDNFNCTLMLAPLRRKYPDVCIDVHSSTMYGAAFLNNPLIDNIILYPSSDKSGSFRLSLSVIPLLGDYDLVFNPHPILNQDKLLSSIYPELGVNLIYAWVRALEDADVDYSLPLETVLELMPEEVQRVDDFVATIPNFTDRVRNLLEIEGESRQTFWNRDWTNAVVGELCGRGELVIVSHKTGVPELAEKFPGLCFNVNKLSIRECAELFNRCDRFFSVSSGLSNACGTSWCKTDIEWIESVSSHRFSSAPIRSAGKVFWLENDLQKFLTILD